MAGNHKLGATAARKEKKKITAKKENETAQCADHTPLIPLSLRNVLDSAWLRLLTNSLKLGFTAGDDERSLGDDHGKDWPSSQPYSPNHVQDNQTVKRETKPPRTIETTNDKRPSSA